MRFFSWADTGLTMKYQAIRNRLGPVDLVMLEVGAFSTCVAATGESTRTGELRLKAWH